MSALMKYDLMIRSFKNIFRVIKKGIRKTVWKMVEKPACFTN